MSLQDAPDNVNRNEKPLDGLENQKEVGAILENSIKSGNCIDCGNLINLDMPSKYFTEKVIGTNGGISLLVHEGQFYMTGDPSVVKSLKESGYNESTMLGVPVEKITNALPYVKNFLISNQSKFAQAQTALDDKYTV